MTIRVILRQDLVNPPQRLTCSKCASILAYTEDDVRVVQDEALFTSPPYRRFLDCPVCKRMNGLDLDISIIDHDVPNAGDKTVDPTLEDFEFRIQHILEQARKGHWLNVAAWLDDANTRALRMFNKGLYEQNKGEES